MIAFVFAALTVAMVYFLIEWEIGFRSEEGRVIIEKESLLAYLLPALPALVSVGSAVWSFLSAVTSTLVPGTADAAKNYALSSGDPLERVRRHFFKSMSRLKRPILVIVDDLDRCKPEYVVELIRGMQTVLKSPRVVFLILGDRDWIEQSFSKVHAEMEGIEVGVEHSFGARFVEKSIQFSFALPAVSDSGRLTYVQRLLKVSDSDEPLGDAGIGIYQEAYHRALEDLISLEDAEERDLQARSVLERFPASINRAVLGEFNSSLAQRAAADQTVEKATRHYLEALEPILPANPRQIKRIINAISLTQEVARIARNIQPGDRDWQVLALWIVLMIEWPKTWFTLSKYPGLVGKALNDEWEQEGTLPDHDMANRYAECIKDNSDVMRILRFRGSEGLWESTAIDSDAILWLVELLPPTSGKLLSV